MDFFGNILPEFYFIISKLYNIIQLATYSSGFLIISLQLAYIYKKFYISRKYFLFFYFIDLIISLILIVLKINLSSNNLSFHITFYLQGILITLFEIIINSKKIPQINFQKPLFQEKTPCDIKIGKYYYNNGVFDPCYISIKDLERHVLIYGQTGSGKTTFLKTLLTNFEKKYYSIPFLLFEFKGEFDDLLYEISDLIIYKPGHNFFINIFNPFGIDIKTYAEFLFDLFKSCRIITDSNEFSPQMEFVMVEVIKKTCIKADNANWNDFMNNLDEFEKLNSDKFPQLSQTTISIKNRLRRYSSGSLNSVFENKDKNFNLDDFMKKKIIIDLGAFLKIGGNKEDIVFFSNIILKWIWEYNIHNNSSNRLRHLTIFEDVSYIASKKLLESSKLSSYLEDIALLLRGKGEGLICLTTSLEISKNIIINAGSKFFFKYNEKPEESLYLLGIGKEKSIDLNQLKIGYCIAKIYSYSSPILLGINPPKKKKKKIQMKNQYFEKASISKNNQKLKLISWTNENEVTEKEIKIQFDKDLIKNKLQIIKDLYLIDDFENCFQNLKKIYEDILKYELSKLEFSKNHKDLYFLEILNENKTKLSQKLLEFMNIYEKLLQLSNENELISNHLNNYIKIVGNYINLNYFNVKDKIITYKEILQKNMGFLLNYFDSINGMEIFYEFGIFDENIKKTILSNINLQVSYFQFQIEEYSFQTFTFDINSEWARGKKELIQLVLYLNKHLNANCEGLKKSIENLIENIKERPNLYKAFYISSDYMKSDYRKEILKINYEFKHELKDFFRNLIERTNMVHIESNLIDKSQFELMNVGLDELNYYIESIINNENINRI